MTPQHPVTPSLASIIFVRIHAFAGRAVAEQARLKEQLASVVTQAIAALPDDDRVVLETQDALAIVMLNDARKVLKAASLVQAASADTPFCTGVNFGPVTVQMDEHGTEGLFGDGLFCAANAADYADPGGLSATRAFRDALADSAPEMAHTLVPAGAFTDAQARTLDVFTPDPQARGRHRRKLLAIATAGAVAILAIGYGGRIMRLEVIRAAQPATILFDIKPQGEIFLDGVVKGRTPPLAQLEVKAGAHSVQIRNAAFPPLIVDLHLDPGERTTIAHKFVTVRKTASPPAAKHEGFWQDLGRKFGIQ